MIEKATDVYYCSKCNVTYDTTIYNHKRPHRHLGRNKKLDSSENIGDEDMPF